jgi:hypothetical protein
VVRLVVRVRESANIEIQIVEEVDDLHSRAAHCESLAAHWKVVRRVRGRFNLEWVVGRSKLVKESA